MLSGEHFGRRHQRSLVTVQAGEQQAEECDDGFAGPDIALHQPRHRMRALHILPDLPPHFLLCIRQIIGKGRKKTVDLRPVFKDEMVVGAGFAVFHQSERQDKDKKFLIGEPGARTDEVFLTVREMHHADRFTVREKAVTVRQFVRQDVLGRIDGIKSLADRFDHGIVCKAARKAIDRLHGAALLFIF